MTVINLHSGFERKAKDIKVQYLDSPVKSENDGYQYRVIKLENGLTALLVSNSASNKDEISQEVHTTEKDDAHEGNEEMDHAYEGDEEMDHAYEGDEEMDDDCEGDEEMADNSDSEGNYPEEMSNFEESEEQELRSAETYRIGMAACGLCIGVGSFSDPLEIQGLAHFLEHMVFMGSKKYPEENNFDAFVNKCGGSSNAWTKCERTKFYFAIQEQHLQPAMDRFAQFFISPLMNKDAINREREAVESEFRMAMPSDINRKEQLFRSFAKTNHPVKNFPWGNLTTLRDNIDDDKLYSELHEFRKRHYSAHRMTLTVLASLSLDTLEDFVKGCFSDVPVNHLPADDFSKFVGKNWFDNPDFRKMYKIKSIGDVCQVELTWVMPPMQHLYKSKPYRYVSLVMGHEGQGSLASYLRKKKWSLDTCCGNSEEGFELNSMYALFRVTLGLTDDGQNHLKEVLETVFSYINMLRREGPQRRIFNEFQQIEKINFRFKYQKNSARYVTNMCEYMHSFPPKDYITGNNLFFEYSPDYIKECIDGLSPDNVNVTFLNKKFNEEEFDRIESWFQTKYSSSEIPKEWVEKWKKIEPLPEFHLPKPNMFITDDFSLIKQPADVSSYPTKIHHDDKSEIWYRPDPKFGFPECFIYLNFVTPTIFKSPKSLSMLNIFINLVKQLVAEELYDAFSSGLRYQLNTCKTDFTVKVIGYNQKLPFLLKTIMRYIADCYKLVSEDLFNVIKKELLKSHYNTFMKPGSLATQVRSSILTTRSWLSTETYSYIAQTTLDEFIDFAKHLTDRMYIRCLAQGNMTQEAVLENIFKCIEILNCKVFPLTDLPRTQVYQIPHGIKCCRVKNFSSMDVNSVVENYYQVGPASLKQSAIIDLLSSMMNEPLFNQLRTQEQLGYSVHCAVHNTYGIDGYSIKLYTQADKFSTRYIDERIEKFIEDFKNTLNEMTEDDFNFLKESFIKLKQCPDAGLGVEVERNWYEIINEDYIFDRCNQIISAVKQLHKQDLRQWMSDHSIGGKDFKKLSIQIVGCKDTDVEVDRQTEHDDSKDFGTKTYSLSFLTNEKNEEEKPADYFITDIESYKSGLPVYTTL